MATLLLHVWANGSYGYFRDELYDIVCGRHLAWGYVDQPPLIPLIARLSVDVFGPSLDGLRSVPALAAAGTVALTCAAARILGGGHFAAWLAGLCVLAGGVLQLMGVLLTTDTLQPLSWLICGIAMIRAVRDGDERWWWLAGVIAGLAFLSKYLVAFYLASLATGLLLTPQRRALRRPEPWLAVLLFALIASPNIRWQAAHGWPFLQHARVLAGAKNLVWSPAAFLGQIALMLDPFTAPVWVSSLLAFAFWRGLHGLRWVAIGSAVLFVLLVAGHGKPYYATAAFPLLFAGGGVAIEAWLARHQTSRALLIGMLAAGGAVLAPFAMPVLPIDTFASYQNWLGLKPRTGERVKLGDLPQYYADMSGWPELAASIGRAYAALPAADRSRAVFLGRNYGEAAAIDVFGAQWDLPPAISGHENYYLWGPRGYDGSVVLTIGHSRNTLLRSYVTVVQVGITVARWAMPEEAGQPIWLCRDRRTSLVKDWRNLKHYD